MGFSKSFSRPHATHEGGEQRVYVRLQELLVDPEQNRNDDARDAHHPPRPGSRAAGTRENTRIRLAETDDSRDLPRLRFWKGPFLH